MNNLTDRQYNILKCVVNAYIETAEPISSKLLSKKYCPDLSSATIRNEFRVLEKNGYIYQPHTSAGRIPTDIGFRSFASSLSEELDNEINYIVGKLTATLSPIRQSDNFFSDLVEEMSSLSNSFAAISAENNFYQHGISELFKNFLSAETDDFVKIAEDIENLEENFSSWIQNTDINKPTIFIGKESPITKSDNISLIINKINKKNKNSFSFIIGPKRMKYNKNLAIIKSIDDLF